jgi:adenylate cyclase
MNWWVRARLRTKIFIAFSSLIIAVLLATLGFTQIVVSREVERTLDRDLMTTGEVFEVLFNERGARLQTNSILLASDFALKSAVATHFDLSTYEPETLASAAQSWQERIGVDLFWITDELGAVLVASSEKDRTGDEIEELSPLREAIESEEPAAGISEVDGVLFQLVAVPVFAPDVIGFLLLGEAVDDRFAGRLKGSTGTDVSFLTAQRVFASSWPKDRRGRVIPPPEARSALLRTRTRTTSPFTAEDERFQSLIVPVESQLPQPLFALMQRSYDEALAPLRALRQRIIIIGTAGLLGALLIGGGLAGGIIAPLQGLVAGMREVLRGNLQYRSRIERHDELGFIAKSFNEMIDGLEERELIRDTFGRFVSHDVAEAVLTGRVPLQGERRDVSILFQDIRGFTTLSEQLDPGVLLRLLNQFFTEVVAAVEAEGGVVKQFLGDGVMALFGAPQPYPDHAERAVRAALGIVQRLKGLNESLVEQGIQPLEIGVGIHSGAVVAGLIGPDNRVEYGVVGDAVNLASRVEALTREMQATILVSRNISAQLGTAFVLGRTATMLVKGKSQPVEVFEVLSLCQPVDSSAPP